MTTAIVQLITSYGFDKEFIKNNLDIISDFIEGNIDTQIVLASNGIDTVQLSELCAKIYNSIPEEELNLYFGSLFLAQEAQKFEKFIAYMQDLFIKEKLYKPRFDCRKAFILNQTICSN